MWLQLPPTLSIVSLLVVLNAFLIAAFPHPCPHKSGTEGSTCSQPTGLSIAPRTDLGTGFQSFFDIGLGWNMYFSSWHAASLPIQPAAWALTNLYAAILTQAQGSRRKLFSDKMLIATTGRIQLRMLSDHPIPWIFVERFAAHMLSITKGGWTGLYQVLLSQADTDTTITVELSILPWK